MTPFVQELFFSQFFSFSYSWTNKTDLLERDSAQNGKFTAECTAIQMDSINEIHSFKNFQISLKAFKSKLVLSHLQRKLKTVIIE